MFLKSKNNFFHTLTFRLTLWYASVFGAFSLVVFLLMYISLISHLNRRTDENLIDTASEFESLYISQGVTPLRSEFNREASSRGVQNVFFALMDNNGNPLACSDKSAWHDLLSHLPDSNVPRLLKTVYLSSLQINVRILRMKTRRQRFLLLAVNNKDNEILANKIRINFSMALLFMLIVAGAAGWMIANKAMKSVGRVTQTAIRIRDGDFSQRVVSHAGGRELTELADAFNDMLEHVHRLIQELKTITDNVAHDLRCPITRIRGLAEITLTGEQNLDTYKNTICQIISECDRLNQMIQTLLDIARMDSGVQKLKKERFRMDTLVSNAVEVFQPLADDKNIFIDTHLPAAPVTLQGDPTLLQRVVSNLLDNAIKFSPDNKKIDVLLTHDTSEISLEICDRGPGISEEYLPHIFKRFYRAEQSRNTPGNGLGLALAHSIIAAHGGIINVDGTSGRCRFIIQIPIRP